MKYLSSNEAKKIMKIIYLTEYFNNFVFGKHSNNI